MKPISFILMALLLYLHLAPAPCAVHPDIVFADFEGGDYGGWQVTGGAFGTSPTQGTLPEQKPVTGYRGHGLANSFLSGDEATGTLTSPPFKIERRYIAFFIGGGGWPGRTCFNLLVQGRMARTATGNHTTPGGAEELRPVAWDVGEFAGQTAQLELVDSATGRWGHILMDHVVFTDTPPIGAELDTNGADGELLYNGIRLPKLWPPRYDDPQRRAPRPVPYLEQPPAVIPIDVGRQLFVDDFLIEQTDLTRVFHHAEKYTGNPILKPETPLEIGDGKMTSATVFQDGVWFDPGDHRFKMWYHAGAVSAHSTTAYATSKDGLTWERPQLDVMPGTNAVLPLLSDRKRDGSAVWLDLYANDPRERYKMYVFYRPANLFGGELFTSADGIHWAEQGRTSLLDPNSDNCTFHYNPFRKKWVFSLRNYDLGRTRAYHEGDTLAQAAHWNPDEVVPWLGADDLDLPDPQIGDRTQLYNLDMIAYESLMLGIVAIHRGPANEVAEKLGTPKITELTLAYSRDGFHWSRPDRGAFLAPTQKVGDWDKGYLHATASLCAIVGDRLYFYYGGWSGQSQPTGSNMYSGGAVGVAFLRRDGFASMDAGEQAGTLTTRTLTFGGKHLFVNLAAPHGELRAEVLDEAGHPIAPFTFANCHPAQGNSTRRAIAWKGANDLNALAGRKIKLRFRLRRGQFYAFWVSPDKSGASYGYVAAGGPEFNGPRDMVGGK